MWCSLFIILYYIIMSYGMWLVLYYKHSYVLWNVIGSLSQAVICLMKCDWFLITSSLMECDCFFITSSHLSYGMWLVLYHKQLYVLWNVIGSLSQAVLCNVIGSLLHAVICLMECDWFFITSSHRSYGMWLVLYHKQS